MLPLEKGMLGLAGWTTSYQSVHTAAGPAEAGSAEAGLQVKPQRSLKLLLFWSKHLSENLWPLVV